MAAILSWRRSVSAEDEGAKARRRLAVCYALMLKRIHLVDFKSFVGEEVELAPLTMLEGANGSGKSNFLDALWFLALEAVAVPGQGPVAFKGADGLVRGRIPQPHRMCGSWRGR